MDGTRVITLHGTLQGRIWMPAIECQQPVRENLVSRANRMVNTDGTGLVDAIKAAVDDAGDFQSAKLTADSYVLIVHAKQRGNRRVTNERIIEVTDLPSLADYVDADAWSVSYD